MGKDRRVLVINHIQEQKKLLKARLKAVLLTSDEAKRLNIQNFHSDKNGKSLELYLKEHAQSEDHQGITKVYLVKDIEADSIVFFFALSAGLLYKEIGMEDINLSTLEKEIVDLCVHAYLQGDSNTTADEVFSWYDTESIDRDKLRRIIEDRIRIKSAAREDLEKTKEKFHINRVSKTFPGIVLSHFCKNTDYSLPEVLSFPIGFYVFWEIIVEQVLHIASLVGCQYLYLFAADNTEDIANGKTVLYTIDWDPDDTDNQAEPIYKLVEYYKNELKFEEVQDLTILKPYYDFNCFSLAQRISELAEHRKAAWIQHSDVDH